MSDPRRTSRRPRSQPDTAPAFPGGGPPDPYDPAGVIADAMAGAPCDADPDVVALTWLTTLPRCTDAGAAARGLVFRHGGRPADRFQRRLLTLIAFIGRHRRGQTPSNEDS